MTDLSRRSMVISMGLGAVALVTLGPARLARADAAMLAEEMKKRIGDATPADGSDLITLELPQIAENGNTVPIGVEVKSPMTQADYVKALHVFAEGNPLPNVATFHFTPRSGMAKASTRMRLAKTQNIVAVAEMSNGKVYMTKTEVKVTIGGCGG